MNYDIIIQRNYDIINQKASHHHMTSVPPSRTFLLVLQDTWPATSPSKCANFAKFRGQNAIFESSNLAYKYGSLSSENFQLPLAKLCPFSSKKNRERKEGERVRETRKFLDPSLGVFGFSRGKTGKFSSQL